MNRYLLAAFQALTSESSSFLYRPDPKRLTRLQIQANYAHLVQTYGASYVATMLQRAPH